MHFGATLRLLRTSSGMSVTGLATQVGVSPAYISRVEHGHDTPPTPDRLRSIAAALGLPEDSLTELVDELRPEAADWLGQSAAGRHLAAELRRRSLGAAQLARVADFVRREFPLTGRSGAIAGLFTEQAVIQGVSVSTLQDAFDVAAVRVVERDYLPGVAKELVPQAHAASGAPPSAIGGGLCLGRAHAPGRPRAVMVLLARPLDVATPDGIAVQCVVVLVGPDDRDVADGLARLAQLASGQLVRQLCEAPSAAAALSLLPG